MRLVKKTGLDPYIICQRCMPYLLITTSRRQQVHILKRTTEPIVHRYCARLRRSYIVNLINSCNELSCVRTSQFEETVGAYATLTHRQIVLPPSPYKLIRVLLHVFNGVLYYDAFFQVI